MHPEGTKGMAVLTSLSRKYRIQQIEGQGATLSILLQPTDIQERPANHRLLSHIYCWLSIALMDIHVYSFPCQISKASSSNLTSLNATSFVPYSQFSLNLHINNTSKTRWAKIVEPLCLLLLLLPPFFHVRLPLPFLSFYVILSPLVSSRSSFPL